MYGTTIGVIKGDTRSLDIGSDGPPQSGDSCASHATMRSKGRSNLT